MSTVKLTSNAELRDLIKLADQQGWIIEQTNGGHLKWIPPDPTMSFVITSATPSDGAFALKKIKNDLEKRGLITDKEELKRKQRAAVTGDITTEDRLTAIEALQIATCEDGDLSDYMNFLPKKMQSMVVDLVAQGIGTIDQMGPCEGCGREFPNAMGAVAHRKKCDDYQRHVTEQAALEVADVPIVAPAIEPEPDTPEEIPMAAVAAVAPSPAPSGADRLTRQEMRTVLDFLDNIEEASKGLQVQTMSLLVNGKHVSIERGEKELEVFV